MCGAQAREAGVPEGVQFERCKLNVILLGLLPEDSGPFGDGLGVLFLQG
jgi:hypothetical protein